MINLLIQTNNGSFNLVLDKGPNEIGGEGLVYKFRHHVLGDCVLKLYQNKDKASRNREKVLFLMKQGIPKTNPNIRFCWPIGAAFDKTSKEFLGFLMAEAFKDSQDLSILSNYSNKYSLAEMYPEEKAWHGKFELSSKRGLLNRLVILSNWALALRDFEKSGTFHLGDIKPENAMVDPKTGKLSIIDIDSCQISANNKVMFQPTAQTPNYRAPELSASTPISENSDSFSFGVCCYIILTGTHPFTNFKVPERFRNHPNTIASHIKDELYVRGKYKSEIERIALCDLHANFDKLDGNLQNLMNRALTNRYSRPTFHEWFVSLKNSIKLIREEVRP